MQNRIILGLIEKVKILTPEGKEREVLARIDTGATTSSMDLKLAKNLELSNFKASKMIKSASGIGIRKVIKVKIQIKDKILERKFTLADRSHMTYQILIGQNILKNGNFLIDPNLK